MIARLFGVAGLALVTAACAVSMPPQYMGIVTGVPPSPEDRARIETALADGSRTGERCPWAASDGGTSQVPCAALPLSQLAGLAWSGNRRAALELGIRFEEGRGVAPDREKARQLYQMAALRTGGTIYVWSPGVGGRPGQVMPVFVPEEPGLPEARARLLALGEPVVLPGGGTARLAPEP